MREISPWVNPAASASSVCVTPSCCRSACRFNSTICCSTQVALAAWASAERGCRAFTSAHVCSFRLAITFLLNLVQVLPEEPLGSRNVLTVEAVAGNASLVTADEDDRVAMRIEGIEDPHRMAMRLDAQLAKSEIRASDGARVGKPQGKPHPLKAAWYPGTSNSLASKIYDLYRVEEFGAGGKDNAETVKHEVIPKVSVRSARLDRTDPAAASA